MQFRPTRYFSIISSIQSVFNLSQTPSDIVTWSGANTLSQSEGSAGGNYFLQLTATSSTGGTITYSKVSGLDAALFGSVYTSGDNKYIALANSPNFESPADGNTDNVYDVVIRATSSNGGITDRTFSITITNEVVTWNTASNQDVYETESSLALSATSTNSYNNVVYAITGGADAAKFGINGTNLTFEGSGTNGEFDYNSPKDANTDNIYVVEVTAYTGAQADGTARTFNLTILEAFRLTVSNLSNFVGTDQDMDFTITYNSADSDTVTSVAFHSSSVLKTAGALATEIQSVLNQAISQSNMISVAVNANSTGSTYIFDITSTSVLVTNIVVKNTSVLAPPLTLTEAKVTDGVTAVKDKFTLTAISQAPYSVILNSGSFTFDNDGTTILSSTPPAGFTTTSASGGSVTFTQGTGSPLGYTFSISSGNGTIASQQNGVTAVAGVAEVFTLNAGGAADGDVLTINGGNVSVVAGTITSVTQPTGYTLTNGGSGFNFATFTANSTGAIADETITSDGTGSSSITVNTQGVTEVSEVKAYVSINVTSVPTFDFTFNTGGANGGSGTIQGTNFTALTTPTGYTVISGGTGNGTAVLEQTTATTLGARYTMATGGSYVTLDTYTDGVTEVLEQHTITSTPTNPTGGTWKPAAVSAAISWNADVSGISLAINNNNGFGTVGCTVSGTLNAGVVTVTQGVGGGAPISDTTLSPVNVDLTAPAITATIT